MRLRRSALRRAGTRPGLVGALVLAASMAAGCSFNQATGRLQLTTISESEEATLGKEVDAEVVAALGLYDDEALAELVARVGASLAAESERPGLSWTFRVLDDPTVNAFALPGGYVYVTRGLLVHLSSEDELAAVLGHEIGHVTARHGVVQLRKSRVAAASVGVFRVIDPNLRHVGGLAASTAGLALLKHSRDDEYEADALGLRYAERAGFDPAATVDVFDMLTRVSRAEAGQPVPDWLSTHPDPELRRDRVASMTKGEGPGPERAFLEHLDGVIYGRDPRDGFMVESTFVHPRTGLRVDVPPGWKAAHEGVRLEAWPKDEGARLMLTTIEAESAQAAFDEFFAGGAIERGEQWSGQVGGFSVISAGLAIRSSEVVVMGLVAFVDYDDTVVAMLALGEAEGWEARSEEVATCFASFGRAEAPLRSVEPMRVRVEELAAETTLARLQADRPSVVDLAELSRLNGVDPEQVLPAGTLVRRVEGLLATAPR
ncbi:MAG: M48 family metalloprotease [Myxococcales bacterium]|nr:M48 family metalloprotease [Myxococcales bacterium]